MQRLGFYARTALFSIAGFALFSAAWPLRPAPAGPRPGTPDDGGDDEHDAFDRVQARAKMFPMASDQVLAQWDRIRASEAERWADRLPGRGQGALGLAKVDQVPGQSWLNLGPTDATIEYNDNNYAAFDTGRPNALLVDPRDPNVVYYAASDGGAWK